VQATAGTQWLNFAFEKSHVSVHLTLFIKVKKMATNHGYILKEVFILNKRMYLHIKHIVKYFG